MNLSPRWNLFILNLTSVLYRRFSAQLRYSGLVHSTPQSLDNWGFLGILRKSLVNSGRPMSARFLAELLYYAKGAISRTDQMPTIDLKKVVLIIALPNSKTAHYTTKRQMIVYKRSSYSDANLANAIPPVCLHRNPMQGISLNKAWICEE